MVSTRASSKSKAGLQVQQQQQPPANSMKVDHNDSPSSYTKSHADDQTKNDKDGVSGGTDDSRSLKVDEKVGDIFEAPDNSILIHACNCEGSWGAGIAAAFKKNYPMAFKLYKAHCDESSAAKLRGTALLIEPCEDKDSHQHFVGCLFTSGGKGKTKDKPDTILERTGPAMRDLLRQIGDLPSDLGIAEVRMCKINSGLFKVPWNDSKAALEDIQIESDKWPSTVVVYSQE